MAEQFLTLMADLDDDTQTRISRWHHDLKEAGFTGTQTPGLPYHISLAKFPLSEERAAIEILQRAAGEFSAVPVHISHIGIFAPGKVLFAAPEINADLAALHRAAAFMCVLAGAGDSVHEVARERLKSHGGRNKTNQERNYADAAGFYGKNEDASEGGVRGFFGFVRPAPQFWPAGKYAEDFPAGV